MFIKQLNKNTVDVFTGNGWENWSRFDLSQGFPKLVSGNALPDEEYKEVLKHGKRLLSKVRQK